MKEVMLELQVVKEFEEAQKVEVEVLNENLEEIKLKSAIFKKEIDLLKAKKQNLSQNLGKCIPTIDINNARPRRQ